MNKERRWIVGYGLNREDKAITTVRLIAMSEFNEIGKYSEEEAEMIVNLIRTLKLPEFKDKHWWGSKTYKEWDGFVESTNRMIKHMINEKRRTFEENTVKEEEEELGRYS